MKKKFFTFIFAICLIIPAMFMLSACSADELLKDYQITIHYDLNGGEWASTDDEIADEVVTYGENERVHFTNQQPIKAGVVFGGWDLDLDLDNAKANIVAVWLDINMAGITTEDGEPITADNAGVGDDGLPTIIPKKADSFVDEDGDGVQDADEPVIEYEFTGWQKSLSSSGSATGAGGITIIPSFMERINVVVVFDFNGGFPSTIVDGTNPTNLELPNATWTYTSSASPCTEEHYYQKKKIYISTIEGGLWKGITKDNRLANASVDQVSIPVREGYVFDGWAVEYHESNSVIYNATDTHVFYYNPSNGVYSSPTNSFNQYQKPGKLIYYAQWREDVPQTVPVRVRFCFNEGMPTTNGTTLTTPNQTWELEQHYYENKIVQAVYIDSTHYQVTVSDDRLANATVDDISIPARTNYTFIGWAIGSHDGVIVLYNPTDVFSYVYDMTVTPDEQLVIFYAQWRWSGDGTDPDGDKFKYVVQFIEDNIDAETAINAHTANTNSIFYGNNPNDGILYENSFGSGAIITTPTITGVNSINNGVNVGGTGYLFDYWTLDPTVATPVNFFIQNSHTTADLTNAFVLMPGVKIARLYAVYKLKDGETPPSEGTKAKIMFIEDCNNFNTGDGSYYADPSHQQYSQNLTDGIFAVVFGLYGANITPTSISAPTATPIGGTYTVGQTSLAYIFAYWTLDPTIATPIDFFATHTNATFNDIPVDATGTGKLYAVYTLRGQSVTLDSWNVDVNGRNEPDKLIASYSGKYQIRVICNDYNDGTNPPNCALNVFVYGPSDQAPTTPTATVTPLTYGQYYSTDVFSVQTGDAIRIEYFKPHNATGGQYFTIELIYLGA